MDFSTCEGVLNNNNLDTEVLECQVGTTEPPHIKWLRKLEPPEGGRRNALELDDNNYAVIDSSQEVLQQRNNNYLSRLQLTRVTQADSGMYICFVTNITGKEPSTLKEPI